MPGDTSYDVLFAQERKVHIMSPDHPPFLSNVVGNVLLENSVAFWLYILPSHALIFFKLTATEFN